MSHTKVFAAFRAGGVPEREASEATDALMSLKESELAAIRADGRALDTKVQRIEVSVASLQAQNRITWGLLVALLALLLRLAWKQGAL
jgi:hypothetical protein